MWGVVGAALLLCALLPSPPALGDEGADPLRTPGPKDQYRRLVQAWTARDAAGVVALVAPRGRLRLSLLSPRVFGTYQPAHARRTLQAYFEQVSGIRLVDVTKPLQRTPRGYSVRHYDYTYSPRGRDAITTRLTIVMRDHGRGLWAVDSIQEMPKPLPGRR